MIIQPEKGTRNVNGYFYEEEKKLIDLLNHEFFQNVELTKAENDVLVWLCSWDEWTVNAVISAFRKVGDQRMDKGGTGVKGRGKPPIGSIKRPAKKTVSKQDKKDLKILADDFGLLHREDVREIIETCKSYAEGQQKIMKLYEAVYM